MSPPDENKTLIFMQMIFRKFKRYSICIKTPISTLLHIEMNKFLAKHNLEKMLRPPKENILIVRNKWRHTRIKHETHNILHVLNTFLRLKNKPKYVLGLHYLSLLRRSLSLHNSLFVLNASFQDVSFITDFNRWKMWRWLLLVQLMKNIQCMQACSISLICK